MPSLKLLRVSFAAAMCGFGMMTFAAEPLTADPGPGIWQEHDYLFQFQGFTTTYSCDGLASKLKLLLIAAGTRADAKVISAGCTRGFGVPDRFARVRLVFSTLAPAAPGDIPGNSITGAWRSVSFADLSPRELRLGDCELVEQFRDKALPLFTTRDVQNRMTCVPNQVAGSVISLKFAAFAAAPAAKGK
jgi:hypothetical protein